MTHIYSPDPRETAKWRAQADRAAEAMKKWPPLREDEVKLGFCFDDAVITIVVPSKLINEAPAQELADHIYSAVLKAASGGSA